MPAPWKIPAPPTQGGLDPTADPAVDAVGRDIRFEGDIDSGGDMPLASTGDYDKVEGEAYARQWILNCLETNPGEYKPRPLYGVGVRRYLKKAITSTILASLKGRTVEALGRNPRFEKVDATVERYRVAARYGIRITVVVTIAGVARTFQPFDFVEAQ